MHIVAQCVRAFDCPDSPTAFALTASSYIQLLGSCLSFCLCLSCSCLFVAQLQRHPRYGGLGLTGKGTCQWEEASTRRRHQTRARHYPREPFRYVRCIHTMTAACGSRNDTVSCIVLAWHGMSWRRSARSLLACEPLALTIVWQHHATVK
jgi:hypothetical protein